MYKDNKMNRITKAEKQERMACMLDTLEASMGPTAYIARDIEIYVTYKVKGNRGGKDIKRMALLEFFTQYYTVGLWCVTFGILKKIEWERFIERVTIPRPGHEKPGSVFPYRVFFDIDKGKPVIYHICQHRKNVRYDSIECVMGQMAHVLNDTNECFAHSSIRQLKGFKDEQMSMAPNNI